MKVCDAVLFAWARRKTIVMPGDVNTSIDIIPVDLVANAMMLASADVLNRTPGVETIQVGSSHVNPIYWDSLLKFCSVTVWPISIASIICSLNRQAASSSC